MWLIVLILYVIPLVIGLDCIQANVREVILEWDSSDLDYRSILIVLLMVMIPIVNIGVVASFISVKDQDYEVWLKNGFILKLFRR